MGLESGTYIDSLVATNPTSDDPKSEGDNHIRLVKSTVLNTFPNIDGAVTATQAELNTMDGITASTAELNTMDGITASTAELNTMDGITATVAELNIMDGVTVTASDINQLTGISGNVQDQIDAIENGYPTLVAGGAIDVDNTDPLNPIIAHEDTSSQTSVDNSGAAVIQDVTLDTYGHITGLASKTLTASDVGAVPSTGGSFTGGITATSITSTGNTTVQGSLLFPSAALQNKTFVGESGVTNLIWKDSSDDYFFSSTAVPTAYQGSVIELQNSIRTIAFSGNVFAPAVDNVVSNGALINRWTAVYAVNGTIQTSDERLKDIEDIGDVSWLYDLEPIAYRWKKDGSQLRYGFGAQTTFEKMPDKDAALVQTEDDQWGMAPDQLIAPMLKLIQQQAETIRNLEERVASLEKGL